MKVNTNDPQILIRLTSTVVMSFVAACLLIMTVLKSTDDVSSPKAMERAMSCTRGHMKLDGLLYFYGRKKTPPASCMGKQEEAVQAQASRHPVVARTTHSALEAPVPGHQ